MGFFKYSVTWCLLKDIGNQYTCRRTISIENYFLKARRYDLIFCITIPLCCCFFAFNLRKRTCFCRNRAFRFHFYLNSCRCCSHVLCVPYMYLVRYQLYRLVMATQSINSSKKLMKTIVTSSYDIFTISVT